MQKVAGTNDTIPTDPRTIPVQPGLESSRNILAARLSAATNLCHAIAACEPEDAAFIMSGVLAELIAGPPPPPLMGLMEEARSWADFASPIEIKAYAVACFLRMPPKVQAKFLAWASTHVSGGGR